MFENKLKTRVDSCNKLSAIKVHSEEQNQLCLSVIYTPRETTVGFEIYFQLFIPKEKL